MVKRAFLIFSVSVFLLVSIFSASTSAEVPNARNIEDPNGAFNGCSCLGDFIPLTEMGPYNYSCETGTCYSCAKACCDKFGTLCDVVEVGQESTAQTGFAQLLHDLWVRVLSWFGIA